jgi:cyclic-di-AMP phosphodiesterase PgpH
VTDEAGHSSTNGSAPHESRPSSLAGKPIPRRPRVSLPLGILLALAFAAVVTPAITADRWLLATGAGEVVAGEPAPVTVRVPAFSGLETPDRRVVAGGIVIARGEVASAEQATLAASIAEATPRGPLPYIALGLIALVLATLFTHHMRRSVRGRLLRVQVVSLIGIALLALAVEVLLLATPVSVLAVPVALFAMVPTLALDRVVGLATGILAALVVGLVGPFDIGVAVLLLVQAATAGLVIAERPKRRWSAVLAAGAVTTVFTVATYSLLVYLTTGKMPRLDDPLSSPWLATAAGPVIATLVTVPLLSLYQLLAGEITHGKLVALEDLSNPLLKQIAERSPGTWQHSLMMANMAEIAANTIGANGRLVRVGAYYHDLGKSLRPKYFIENLEPGETSPHDQLPPEVSCDAIFAHVTEGIAAARRAGLHERIIDFMHMHHGDGVLEYFWGKCREQGNPRGLAVERFRYPGHPPQSRETAILAICDAVEAASRTLKKPEPAAIDSLVQRIVYGKLHLGQLDESGLSMGDLRRIADSLRETIRHANHGRIEYPWQKAQQDASASEQARTPTGTEPRLDSLDRPADAARTSTDRVRSSASVPIGASQLATTGEHGIADTAPARIRGGRHSRPDHDVEPALAIAETADIRKAPEPASASQQGEWLPPEPSVAPAVADELAAPRPPVVPPPPPDGVITSATFAARKRAATLPPPPSYRPPTVPPPMQTLPGAAPPAPPAPASDEPLLGTNTLQGRPAPSRRPAMSPAPPVLLETAHHRTAGPPPRVDLENAVTNPPPLRRGPTGEPVTRLPAAILPDDAEGRRTEPHPVTTPITHVGHVSGMHHVEDAGRTEPSMPKLELPSRPPRGAELAARVEAALESDEWGPETPVVPPTRAELRSLLGVPDPTRKQSLDEIEALHRAATEDVAPDPELFATRRPPPATSEVDPDDIEAAIEVAPRARNRPPSAIGIARPKKPQ